MPVARSVLAAALALGMALTAEAQPRVSTRYDVTRMPFVAIGDDGSGNGPLLEAVFSATRTHTGYVIGDARATAMFVVDAKGTLVRTIGGRGQGPGEFTGAIFVSQCAGDSLFAWDSRGMRVAVFTAGGTYVRQFPAYAARVTCAPNGNVMALQLRPSAGAAGRGPAGLVSAIKLVNLRGDSVGGIASVPFGENRMFGAATTIAMRRDTLYVGTATEPAIGVYDRNGNFARRIVFAHVPVRITPEAHANAVEGLYNAMKAAGIPNADEQRAAMLAQPVPESFPPYREIAVAPNGIVWLLTSQLSDHTAKLRGVRDDGTVVSEVSLPAPGARLLEAGDDYLLLAYDDPSGAIKVGAFRVTPRSG